MLNQKTDATQQNSKSKLYPENLKLFSRLKMIWNINAVPDLGTFINTLETKVMELEFLGKTNIMRITYKKVILATLGKGDPKAPFQSLLHRCVGKGATPFLRFLHITLDPYIVMLSSTLGGTKYHFLYLLYDSTWDWTPVSRTIAEHSLGHWFGHPS